MAEAWSNVNLVLPDAIRTQYTFKGWAIAPGQTKSYTGSEVIAMLMAEGRTEITLYAIWANRPDGNVPTIPTVPSTPEDGMYSLRGTGMNTYTKTYTYDLAGNRTSFVLTKDGETVHTIVYQYDALNRLTKVLQNGASAATYTYDSNGNRVKLTYGNGVTTTYAYNKANWVTSITGKKGSTTVTRYDYTYYASGNQRSVTDKDGVVTSYTYDGLGRLTQESETGGLTVAYTYDGAGNRSKMVVTGTENYTTTYTYDKNNRLTQESKKVGNTTTTTVYTYDANGNLVKKRTPNGAEQYDYNGFDQLTVLKQGSAAMTYAYNASGIRTAKRTENSDTYFLLDGGDVVAEYTDGELTASYLRGINLISSTTSNTKYYLHNAHGDVVALANSSGTVTKRYDYDAFGNEENPSDSDTNPFRYCGEYFDTETETYYLRARYYAPTTGRFTQQDTHWSPANAIYGDNPRKVNERQDALGLNTYAYAPEITAIMQSGNLYVYCVNNPVQYCDSTGNAVAKSYDSGDNDLAIMIAAIVAISAGEIVYFAKQNHAKGSSGKIGGGTAIAGAPMPDPDDDDDKDYKKVSNNRMDHIFNNHAPRTVAKQIRRNPSLLKKSFFNKM